MRISHQMRYDAPPAEVHAMLTDPAFREKVCAFIRAESYDVQVTATPDGSGHVVVIEQHQRPSRIPSFAAKFVGDTIHIVQREEWFTETRSTLEVGIPGKPGHLKGDMSLVDQGGATVQQVEAEVKVHIPLVGGKLEGLIADMLGKGMRAEEKVGQAWLAGDR